MEAALARAAHPQEVRTAVPNMDVGDGFHRQVLPMIDGELWRLEAIAMKLKGVMAATKPSRARYSCRFQTPKAFSVGCCVCKGDGESRGGRDSRTNASTVSRDAEAVSSGTSNGIRALSSTPLRDIPSCCCSFTGPWTVTRSSLRMLRRVAAFCRPLRPVLLLVSFRRSRSPVVGVLGLCWMWRDVPFACQRRPIIGVLRMCWLLPGSFDCFCCPHTSVLRPSIACLAVFLCGPGALFLHALSGPSTICPFPPPPPCKRNTKLLKSDGNNAHCRRDKGVVRGSRRRTHAVTRLRQVVPRLCRVVSRLCQMVSTLCQVLSIQPRHHLTQA